MIDASAADRWVARDGLRRSLPWIRDEVFDLRNKQEFKDNVARAVCCALPRFDLVIVDEGHNLKTSIQVPSLLAPHYLGCAVARTAPNAGISRGRRPSAGCRGGWAAYSRPFAFSRASTDGRSS
jgi:hypothetical protein